MHTPIRADVTLEQRPRVWGIVVDAQVTCRAGRSPAVAATISGVAGRGKCAGTSLRVGILRATPQDPIPLTLWYTGPPR